MSRDYITLVGAEDVRHAGHNMIAAADAMRRAASTIDETMRQHQQFMDGWLERFQMACAPLANGDTDTLRSREVRNALIE